MCIVIVQVEVDTMLKTQRLARQDSPFRIPLQTGEAKQPVDVWPIISIDQNAWLRSSPTAFLLMFNDRCLLVHIGK